MLLITTNAKTVTVVVVGCVVVGAVGVKYLEWKIKRDKITNAIIKQYKEDLGIIPNHDLKHISSRIWEAFKWSREQNGIQMKR